MKAQSRNLERKRKDVLSRKKKNYKDKSKDNKKLKNKWNNFDYFPIYSI